MSDDPETARQIAALAMGTRPLLVCDVDDVLLEFVRPFMAWLETQGMELKTDSFKLTGNIRTRGTGAVAPQEEVSALLGGFFDAQADWQTPAAGALATLGALDHAVDIVLLPSHHPMRAIGRVVDCRRNDDGQFAIAIEFDEIREEDRETLIQHITCSQLCMEWAQIQQEVLFLGFQLIELRQ